MSCPLALWQERPDQPPHAGLPSGLAAGAQGPCPLLWRQHSVADALNSSNKGLVAGMMHAGARSGMTLSRAIPSVWPHACSRMTRPAHSCISVACASCPVQPSTTCSQRPSFKGTRRHHTCAMNQGVAGQHLLHQGAARAGHAHHKDGQPSLVPSLPLQHQKTRLSHI